MSDLLDELRSRIAQVDAELLRLVSERLALVREIGAAKREAALPIRSFEAEAEVLSRYQRLAAELAIDQALAEQLAHQLIGAAVREQEEAQSARAVPARRFLIVGGAGKMGRWLTRFFAGQGHEITTYDPAGAVAGFAHARDLAPAVRDAEVVLVATPLSAGPEALRSVLRENPSGLVADIFSLKSHVLGLLREAARRGGRVASLHPLFGPEVRTLSGRVMAVLDCGNAAAAADAEALFRDTALTISRLPIEQHDACMQYVLGLSHLVAILFFATLTASGRPFAELAATASTTFHKEARTAAEVARENPYLYYEIQHLNRHSAELFALVKARLATIEAAALSEDPEAFVRLLRDGRTYFPASFPAEID